jgi:hypothetical protein
MHSFNDKTGTEWIIELHLGNAMLIEAHDFTHSLGNGEDPVRVKFLTPQDDLFNEVITNDAACFDMIWCCCKEQAEKIGVTNQYEFAKRLTGKSIADARLAFYEELPNFFHRQETTLRALIKRFSSLQIMATKKIGQAMEEELEHLDLEKILDLEIEKAKTELAKVIQETNA